MAGAHHSSRGILDRVLSLIHEEDPVQVERRQVRGANLERMLIVKLKEERGLQQLGGLGARRGIDVDVRQIRPVTCVREVKRLRAIGPPPDDFTGDIERILRGAHFYLVDCLKDNVVCQEERLDGPVLHEDTIAHLNVLREVQQVELLRGLHGGTDCGRVRYEHGHENLLPEEDGNDKDE